jgi:hypothetical protein
MSPRLIERLLVGDYTEDINLFNQHNKLTRALFAMCRAHIIRIERVYKEQELSEAQQTVLMTKEFREEFNKGTFDSVLKTARTNK